MVAARRRTSWPAPATHITDALDAVAEAPGRHARGGGAGLDHGPSGAKPIPIVGSQNPERIRASVKAYDIKFSRADWYAVLTAARGEPLP